MPNSVCTLHGVHRADELVHVMRMRDRRALNGC